MKVSVRLLALLISLMLCALCLAQNGGGGARQRGGGRGGNLYSIPNLLRNTEVQTELQITDDEKTKISDLRTSLRGQGGGGQGGTPPTPEERAARQKEQEKQYEALLTADQVKRIHEIQIQLMEDQAITLPDVQTGLGLSDDQKAKVKSLMDDYGAAQRSVFQKAQNNEIDPAAATAARTKNTHALKDGLHGVLTADQVTKLQTMGGKPFKLTTPMTFGGGRRGRGGGGG